MPPPRSLLGDRNLDVASALDKKPRLLLATVGLANVYLRAGKLVEKNEAEADRLVAAALPALRDAAEQNNPWAAGSLGVLYKSGWGVAI